MDNEVPQNEGIGREFVARMKRGIERLLRYFKKPRIYIDKFQGYKVTISPEAYREFIRLYRMGFSEFYYLPNEDLEIDEGKKQVTITSFRIKQNGEYIPIYPVYPPQYETLDRILSYPELPRQEYLPSQIPSNERVPVSPELTLRTEPEAYTPQEQAPQERSMEDRLENEIKSRLEKLLNGNGLRIGNFILKNSGGKLRISYYSKNKKFKLLSDPKSISVFQGDYLIVYVTSKNRKYVVTPSKLLNFSDPNPARYILCKPMLVKGRNIVIPYYDVQRSKWGYYDLTNKEWRKGKVKGWTLKGYDIKLKNPEEKSDQNSTQSGNLTT